MKRFKVRGEEDIQGPSAAACPGLDEVHQVLVDVRPLLTVYLDAHKVGIEIICRFRIRECLPGHHMAPVARGITYRDEQRFILSEGICQGLTAPFLPPYRVAGMLPQVR